MSDIIRLLPDSVANQIAAGEVIQRPASVIKELVENAIDAGAQHVDVLVVDAGKTSIQVIDDGKGMSETDARLSLSAMRLLKFVKLLIYLLCIPWDFVERLWLLLPLWLRWSFVLVWKGGIGNDVDDIRFQGRGTGSGFVPER